MKIIHTLMYAGILLLGACATMSPEAQIVANGGRKLSNADLTALVSKPLVYDFQFVQAAGVSGTVTVDPGGIVSVAYRNFQWDNKDVGTDSGNWRIDGETLCNKWKVTNNGREVCSYWYQTKENVYTTVRTTGQPGSYNVVKP